MAVASRPLVVVTADFVAEGNSVEDACVPGSTTCPDDDADLDAESETEPGTEPELVTLASPVLALLDPTLLTLAEVLLSLASTELVWLCTNDNALEPSLEAVLTLLVRDEKEAVALLISSEAVEGSICMRACRVERLL